jgi:ATP-dependent helicase/nuclease subunit A
MNFTENQIKAKAYDRNLSIEANAGSGKTAVLIERFTDILLNEPEIRIKNLVGITFTEKAAKELKNRIFTKLTQITAANNNYSIKAGFIIERLSLLQISTIHSFCANILREHPNESGVDPNFKIIEGIDIRLYLDQIINETLRKILDSDENSGIKADLTQLLKIYGKKKTFKIINELITKRELLNIIIEKIYQKSDDEINTIWYNEISDFTKIILDQSQFIHSLEKYKSLYLKNGHLIPEYNKTENITTRCNCFRELYREIYTKEGKPRKDLFKKNDFIPELFTDLENIRKNINKIDGFFEYIDYFADKGTDTSSLKFQIEITKKFISISDNILESYNNYKNQNALLDFDDLLLKVKEILQIKEVRDELQERFLYVMVDEYQDTNHLQYEILKLLMNDFNKGNLFIVGDPKQSIYGFRNAEVEIFSSTTEAIKNINSKRDPEFKKTENVAASEDELNGQIKLNESFRLLSDIVVFTNYLFKQLMVNDFINNINYTPLIKARNNTEPGKVEFLLVPHDNAKDGYEEELIARKILSLIKKEENIFLIGSEEKKKIQYGDIAILLRSRTNLKLLEKTFIKYGIPFIVSSGIGYFQTQEIYDLYSYLKFIQNERDDLSLAGILRSPFFSLSDADLFTISQISSSRISFWEKLKISVEKDLCNENVKNAFSILSGDLVICKRLPIPSIINRIITQTNWIGAVSGIPEGEQIVANLNKFTEIARDFTHKGFSTLYDFIEKIKILTEEEEKEGQAVIDPTNEMVKIMTIHASKGLEFPIVFIPYIHRKFNKNREPLLNKKFGIGFSVPDMDDYDNNQNNSIINRYLKTLSRMSLNEEEKRIFYVAITRAHNRLFLSGKYNFNEFEQTYLGWLKTCFNLDDNILQKRESENKTEDKKKSKPEYDLISKEIIFNEPLIFSSLSEKGFISQSDNEYLLKINTITNTDMIEIPESNTLDNQKEVIHPGICIGKSEGAIKGISFSATLMQTYISCPMKYYLKYFLGVNEELLQEKSESEIQKTIYKHKIRKSQQDLWNNNNSELTLQSDEMDASISDPDLYMENDNPYILPGTIKGKILHKIFEDIDKIHSNPGIIEKIIFNASLPYFLNPLDLNSNLFDSLKNTVLNFLDSKCWSIIKDHPVFYCEYELHSKFGADYMIGTIDRFIINEAQKECYIIDYKTNNLKNKDILSHSKNYEYQMLFYSYLINKMLPDYTIKPYLFFLNDPGQPVGLNISNDMYNSFEHETGMKIQEIKDIELEKTKSGINLEHCDYCEYCIKNKCVINN